MTTGLGASGASRSRFSIMRESLPRRQRVDFRAGSMSEDVQIAVERARTRIGESLWNVMTSHEQTIEIYRELRALDAERVAGNAVRKPTTSGGDGPSR